jgi:hypothetical protein
VLLPAALAELSLLPALLLLLPAVPLLLLLLLLLLCSEPSSSDCARVLSRDELDRNNFCVIPSLLLLSPEVQLNVSVSAAACGKQTKHNHMHECKISSSPQLANVFICKHCQLFRDASHYCYTVICIVRCTRA